MAGQAGKPRNKRAKRPPRPVMSSEHSQTAHKGAIIKLSRAFQSSQLDKLPGQLKNADNLTAFLDLLSLGMTRHKAALSLGLGYHSIQEAYNTIPIFEAACERASALYIKKAHQAVALSIEGGQLVKKVTRTSRQGDTVEEEQYSVADGNLALKVLERKMPDEWNPTQKVEHSGNVTVEHRLTDLTENELNERIAELAKRKAQAPVSDVP